MISLVLASAVSLALAPAHAQTRPDFSGTWRMDASRSESALQAEPVGPVTVAITQTADELRIETTTRHGTTTELYRLAPPGAAAAAGGAPVARWRGQTLVTEVVRSVRGQSVTTQQSWTLSADGNEMTVESVVNVQHGYSVSNAKIYGAGRDVFVRVRP